MNEELEDNPRAVAEDSDNEAEPEAVDYRFLSAIKKKDCSIPARGEKDFEPDGTNKQTRILQSSRDAMYAALSVERELSSKSYIRATWDTSKSMGRLHAADARGTMFKSIGKADRDGLIWLEPEELLFMVERGNIECFYEHKDIAMSLQAAYAELIPHIGVDEFQVYTYLKRAGYMVLRTRPPQSSGAKTQSRGMTLLSQRLSAVLTRVQRAMFKPSCQKGSLKRDEIYHSYNDVYARLAMVRFHTAQEESKTAPRTNDSLQVLFDIWKPNTHFRKSSPGPPDFRIAVLNSRNHNLSSVQQLNALFASLPDDEGYDKMSQFTKLKIGRRHCILAIADLGVISFMSLGDVSFASEPVYVPWKPLVQRPKKSQQSKAELSKIQA